MSPERPTIRMYHHLAYCAWRKVCTEQHLKRRNSCRGCRRRHRVEYRAVTAQTRFVGGRGGRERPHRREGSKRDRLIPAAGCLVMPTPILSLGEVLVFAQTVHQWRTPTPPTRMTSPVPHLSKANFLVPRPGAVNTTERESSAEGPTMDSRHPHRQQLSVIPWANFDENCVASFDERFDVKAVANLALIVEQ